MFDDEMNDAIDSNLQAAIGHARGRTLQGMVPTQQQEQVQVDPEEEAALEEMMEAEQKQSGGGGIGALVGALGG